MSQNKIQYDCGCTFFCKDNKPIVDYNIENINLSCYKTYNLISSGNTVGLFQIDSDLGQQLSKKLKPENIHHLAALIAIMRPAALKGKLQDNISIAEHYIKRKNRQEDISIEYPALKHILNDTYQLLIYQEQTIQIGQEIAGMSLEDADYYLRMGIGKKKADIIAKAEQVFITGAKKVGKVSSKDAYKIFSWIKSAARYQFNASHSYAYALTTFLTALVKTHFPYRFYVSWLNHSKEKIQPLYEIKKLVKDARNFDIEICLPDLRLKNSHFMLRNNKIYFGLSYIKGIGEKGVQILSNLPDISSYTWPQLLFKILLSLNKTITKNLIAVGALDYLNIPREQMLYEHNMAMKLTAKEVSLILPVLESKNILSIKDVFEYLTDSNLCKITKRRQNILKSLKKLVVNPEVSNKDKIGRIIALEETYLGTSISFHKTEETSYAGADTLIKEIKDGKIATCYKLVVQINKIKQIFTKNHEEMAFLSVEDVSGEMDLVCFPQVFTRIKNNIFEGGTFLICGNRTKRNSISILSIKPV